MVIPMADSHSNKRGKNQAGELFIVATPIGNLGDITLRALETLKSADLIACEDTRTSGVLLKHYGITTRTTAYHEHNEAKATAQLLEKLQQGTRIALISDAGTPLLSDPGLRLVQAAAEGGIRVTPLPGASALLAALSISGLGTGKFTFAGFLPPKAKARAEQLSKMSTIPVTLIFYEAPHRLLETLEAMHAAFGDRSAAVGRELTKLHEECRRGPLSALITHYEKTPPRGECVVLVEGAAVPTMDDKTIDASLKKLLKERTVKDAAAELAAATGRSKSELYQRALQLKDAE